MIIGDSNEIIKCEVGSIQIPCFENDKDGGGLSSLV